MCGSEASRGPFRHDVGVTTTPLHSTDAFYVIDLDGAPSATGIVRCAKKVLVDGAANLARTITYAYASFAIKASGASAGINAVDDARADAIARFVEEVAPLTESQTLLLDAGKGLTPAELAPLAALDARFAGRLALHDRLLAASVTAAAAAARPSLDGATVCVEDIGEAAESIAVAFRAHGATVEVASTADALATTADVLCAGSKVGLIDHDVAAAMAPRLVVPTGPIPVTARGLAVARRAGIDVLPDFVSTAGPLLANWPADDDTDAIISDIAKRTTVAVESVSGHPDGHVLGACMAAEQFLATWVDELPFGRPLA
jgi:hypothetical protein